ncbi:MAG TPA: flavin monoamine oxidase family protein [Acidimicrobiia bacterium]|nr:flavin monoamine oxidase family protein [Acidimicrobiia bacterium]
MTEVDVVVVGAGLAGLSAARDLTRKGLEVVVLEGRDRVGGRTFDQPLRNGVTVEFGGQWIGPTQDVIASLVDELDLETFPTYVHGEDITFYDGEAIRHTSEDFGLPEKTSAEVVSVWERIEVLAEQVSTASPWTGPEAETYDEMTVATWLRAQTGDELALRFFGMVVPAIFAAEPGEMSMLHFLFYVASGNGLSILAATEGGAQERRVVGGAQAISQRLARELGAAVHLRSGVHAIRHSDSEVRAIHNEGEVAASHIVVAIPPTLAGRISYDPPLPAQRDSLTQQVPAGSVIKVNVGYATPFWRGDGLSGLVLGLDDEFGLVFDNSPPDGTCGVLVAFAEGDHSRHVRAMSEQDRNSLLIDTVTSYFGPKASDPFDIVAVDWSTEQWTRGCYGAHMGSGVWTQYGPALAEPIGRIHWAGTETEQVWNGYMDGAVRSGLRAAAEIVDHQNASSSSRRSIRSRPSL